MHVLPSAPYDVPLHGVHDPLESLLPAVHLVHDGTACPAVPSVQLTINVHDMPSLLYDVPGHGEHSPLTGLLPAVHLVQEGAG